MLKKLEAVLERFEKLTALTADPQVLSDMSQWKAYAKERADMEETVEKYREFKKVEADKTAVRTVSGAG